jgi:hypothetical protein
MRSVFPMNITQWLIVALRVSSFCRGNTAMHVTSDYIHPYRSERVSRCLSTGGQRRHRRKPDNEKMLLASRSRQLSQKPESIPFSQWGSQTLKRNLTQGDEMKELVRRTL